MERKKIEEHLKNGEYSTVFSELKKHDASAWRDTTELRCLRSKGSAKHALLFAQKLLEQLQKKTSPYGTTLSERNHLRRYIALVFAEQGQASKAIELMKSLLDASPGIAALHREYAFALTTNGQFDLAEQQLKLALMLHPSHASTQAQLARLYCRSARVKAGYDGYQRAATLDPGNSNYIQQLVHWSNYLTHTTHQSNFQLAKCWSSSLAHQTSPACLKDIEKNPDRPLKIGLVSGNMRAHASSFFIKPLLRGLDANAFSVTAYHTDPRVDAVSKQISNLTAAWLNCAQMSDDKLSERIISDKIDILIELDGHSKGNRLALFNRRNAPIQISWLGGVSTSGLEHIDCRITDRSLDPVGLDDAFYSESLVRLQNGALCYEPLSKTPDVNPIESKNIFRFGSFNSPEKISTLTLDCWAAALHAVKNSALMLKHKQLQSKQAQEHILQALADRGIDSKRVKIHSSKQTAIDEHLNSYNQIDVALDTSPFNGRTTTFEALWMGVPVLSLSGHTHCSRVTSSILKQLNLADFATESIHEFANQAQRVANDRTSLVDLKAKLRSKLSNSNLLNSNQFGRDFGYAIREQWRQWLSTKSSQTVINNDIQASVVK